MATDDTSQEERNIAGEADTRTNLNGREPRSRFVSFRRIFCCGDGIIAPIFNWYSDEDDDDHFTGGQNDTVQEEHSTGGQNDTVQVEHNTGGQNDTVQVERNTGGQNDTVPEQQDTFGLNDVVREEHFTADRNDAVPEKHFTADQNDDIPEELYTFGQNDDISEELYTFGQNDDVQEKHSTIGQNDTVQEEDYTGGKNDGVPEEHSTFSQNEAVQEEKYTIGQNDAVQEHYTATEIDAIKEEHGTAVNDNRQNSPNQSQVALASNGNRPGGLTSSDSGNAPIKHNSDGENRENSPNQNQAAMTSNDNSCKSSGPEEAPQEHYTGTQIRLMVPTFVFSASPTNSARKTKATQKERYPCSDDSLLLEHHYHEEPPSAINVDEGSIGSEPPKDEVGTDSEPPEDEIGTDSEPPGDVPSMNLPPVDFPPENVPPKESDNIPPENFDDVPPEKDDDVSSDNADDVSSESDEDISSAYSDDVPLEDVPDDILHKIIFWDDGFTVNDGPLRMLDDPQSTLLLEKISRCQCPTELVPETHSHRFMWCALVRRDEMCPREVVEGVYSLTRGKKVSARLITAEPISIAQYEAEPMVLTPSANLNLKRETCQIRLRLADGTSILGHFNLHQKIRDIRAFIDAWRPEQCRTYRLHHVGFPVKNLDDPYETIQEAEVANTVILQKLEPTP